jgi:hypothetical protein
VCVCVCFFFGDYYFWLRSWKLLMVAWFWQVGGVL